jgi:hypothetical protein
MSYCESVLKAAKPQNETQITDENENMSFLYDFVTQGQARKANKIFTEVDTHSHTHIHMCVCVCVCMCVCVCVLPPTSEYFHVGLHINL